MSEYQYYEFLAVDRPLTTQEMAALRERSSRAHITPVSFTNTYNWGDLKGDPREWMKRYFDLHVYVANWSGVGVRFECGRARSRNLAGVMPAPEGWPATG